VVERTFTFETDGTCKETWVFTLEDTPDGVVVLDLEIGDRERPRGCTGHPGTITALVRGRVLESIDLDALSEAACGRDLACGQALARCVRELVEERRREPGREQA
jgi:hypothetical protein